jgi:hypothetical protein
MTALEILADPRELYMNVPEGFVFAQKIEKSDIGGLKSFLIGLSPDDNLQEDIRQMTNEQVIHTCLDNNFTFDEEYLGARLFDWQIV